MDVEDIKHAAKQNKTEASYTRSIAPNHRNSNLIHIHTFFEQQDSQTISPGSARDVGRQALGYARSPRLDCSILAGQAQSKAKLECRIQTASSQQDHAYMMLYSLLNVVWEIVEHKGYSQIRAVTLCF